MTGKQVGMPLLRAAFCVVALVLLFGGAARVASAGDAEYVLKYSWVDPYDPSNPGAHFASAYAAVFQYQVELLTGGRVKAELYPSAQLADQNGAAQQVANGTIEMAQINIGNIATVFYPKFSVVNLPFLFTSQEHARRALSMSNPVIKEMAEDLAKESGLRILSILPVSPRYISNNRRPVVKPDDMKGLKIRTMESVPHMVMIESFGAIPVPIAFPELYTSLQTNVVDGQENSLSNFEIQKFYQVQKYVTMTGHAIDMGAIVINDKLYREMPDDLRAALVEAEYLAQMAFISTPAVYDSTGVEKLTKNGMEFSFLSPEQIKAFRDRCVPAVREYLDEEVGKEFVDRFLKSVDDAKQSIVDESKVD